MAFGPFSGALQTFVSSQTQGQRAISDMTLNGRGNPKMPAFKDELAEEQIWQVVTYVQTLRKKN